MWGLGVASSSLRTWEPPGDSRGRLGEPVQPLLGTLPDTPCPSASQTLRAHWGLRADGRGSGASSQVGSVVVSVRPLSGLPWAPSDLLVPGFPSSLAVPQGVGTCRGGRLWVWVKNPAVLPTSAATRSLSGLLQLLRVLYFLTWSEAPGGLPGFALARCSGSLLVGLGGSSSGHASARSPGPAKALPLGPWAMGVTAASGCHH